MAMHGLRHRLTLEPIDDVSKYMFDDPVLFTTMLRSTALYTRSRQEYIKTQDQVA